MPAPRAPSAPRPAPRVKFSERLKKAGGTLVAKTGAMRVKLTGKAKAGFSRMKRRLGLSGTKDVGAGNKDAPNEGVQKTPEQTTKQKEDDPDSQHSPEGKERTKKSFMEKAQKGAIVGLMALPLALLLAAVIQGGIDCDNINKLECDITDINSAAWPDYPDWWPDWLPAPQSDKNKVWISYSPAVHLLMNDTITIKTSNTSGDIQTSITGDHGIKNNDDDAMTLIQLADNFDPTEDFSNVTAIFEISTNCEDRMAYAAGQDLKEIAEAGNSVFGAFFDAVPWKTMLYVIIFLAAVWLFWQGVQIARS